MCVGMTDSMLLVVVAVSLDLGDVISTVDTYTVFSTKTVSSTNASSLWTNTIDLAILLSNKQFVTVSEYADITRP
jgi:hypothetical protein